VLNRGALILKYKQPFVDWVKAADPFQAAKLSLAEANHESNVYLVEVEDEEELEAWLSLNYEVLFDEELAGWYTDPALWPQDRSFERFKQWFHLEFHSVVFDTGTTPLDEDGI
jgi:hypothetical protein